MSDIVQRLRADPIVNIFELCKEAADRLATLAAAERAGVKVPTTET